MRSGEVKYGGNRRSAFYLEVEYLKSGDCAVSWKLFQYFIAAARPGIKSWEGFFFLCVIGPWQPQMPPMTSVDDGCVGGGELKRGKTEQANSGAISGASVLSLFLFISARLPFAFISLIRRAGYEKLSPQKHTRTKH